MKKIGTVLKAIGWGAPLFFLLGLTIYFGIPGYSFSGLIAFGVAGLIGCYRIFKVLSKRYPKTANGLRIVLTLCLSLGLTAALITGVFIVRAGLGSADTPCQYVILLGAGVDGTRPSLSLRYRLDAAYDYLTANPDAICIVSGGQGPGEDITEAACMYADLTSKGIAPERIWQEAVATNTRENIAYSLALIEEKTGVRPERAGIISSEFHLYRAGMFAARQGLTMVGIPAKTQWVSLRINYTLREIVAVWYYMLFGG